MSSSTPLPPDDTVTLDYRPEEHLLIARWLAPQELPQLQASYEALLAAAEANGSCRHWLLDVRRRPIGEPVALKWFEQAYSPRLVATLGGPVFVAYFAMITQEVVRENAPLHHSIVQGEQNGAHYHYFNLEAEALAWLAQQP